MEPVLREADVRTAVEELFSCALLGTGFETALHRLARAANARGGNLICNQADRSLGGFASPDVAATQRRYFSSSHPPDSRFVRVRVGPGRGFRSDHADFTAEEIARDPYYQEFLRPEGLQWHATCWLATFDGVSVEISLKREPRQAPFTADDIAVLDRVLPDLRRAMLVGRSLLDAEARGVVNALSPRAAATYQIDRTGKVTRPPEIVDERDLPLKVVRGRLATDEPRDQGALDRLLAAALASQQSAVLPLGDHWQAVVVPVTGASRDLFNAARAVVVLQGSTGSADRLGAWSGLRQAYSLTRRETEVAALLAEGTQVAGISTSLGISEGTVRTHIKSLYAKTGTHRLSELAVLIARLRL